VFKIINLYIVLISVLNKTTLKILSQLHSFLNKYFIPALSKLLLDRIFALALFLHNKTSKINKEKNFIVPTPTGHNQLPHNN
jgi:hypothetical protein